jgi:N-glycosidase YbiA
MIDMSAIPADGRILYFERDRADFGFLSHFHFAPINLDGEMWPTVEHFYQAQKSDHPDYRAAVRSAERPGLAKRLAAPPDAPRRTAQKSWFRKEQGRPAAGLACR